MSCGTPVGTTAATAPAPVDADEGAASGAADPSSATGRRRGLLVAVAAVVLFAGASVALFVLRADEPADAGTEIAVDDGRPAGTEASRDDAVGAPASTTTLAQVDDGGTTSTSTAVTTTTTLPPTSSSTSTTTTLPAPIEIDLSEATATATAVRTSVILRCDRESGTNVRTYYTPDRLIDGDLNTGWGAGPDDGAGESITIDFGDEYVLTEVGLTPGFAKVGPRSDTNCQATEAFPHNAFVASVRYMFDDGSSVIQEFEQRKDLQTLDLIAAAGGPVRTQRVTITILETVFPPGADIDTIISEARFWGYWGFA